MKPVFVTPILLLIAPIPPGMLPDNGSIEGVISDDRGPVADALVEADNPITGAVGYAKSNAAGHYVLEGLRAGRYSLWVQAAGHDSIWIPKILVERSQTTHQDLTLTRTKETMNAIKPVPGESNTQHGTRGLANNLVQV